MILLEELHDRVITRLSPVEYNGNLHDQLEGIALRPILGQDEVNIVLLTHTLYDADEVLLLNCPCLVVLNLPQRLR